MWKALTTDSAGAEEAVDCSILQNEQCLIFSISEDHTCEAWIILDTCLGKVSGCAALEPV